MTTTQGAQDTPYAQFVQPYVRERSLGGSDMGVLLGLNPFKTPRMVWDDIMGRRPREPDGPDQARGHALEPIIRDLYVAHSGERVEVVGRVYDAEFPQMMHATVDGKIVEGPRVLERGPGILEIKCHRQYRFQRLKDEGIEPAYYAQMQHYMAVLDVQWGQMAAFNAEEWALWTFVVERNDTFIEAMRTVAVQWWMRHVQGGEPPEMDGALAVRDGRAAAMANVPARVGADIPVVRDGAVWQDAVRDVVAAKEHVFLHKRAETLAVDRLKALMATDGLDAVSVPGVGKVRWRESVRRTVDVEALKAAHPELDVTPFERASVVRTFLVTARGERGEG